MSDHKSTGLWRRAFESEPTRQAREPTALLSATYATFRERASVLTAQIAKALPALTIHDITHLDALWETADLIAGENYPLNPAEAFVFGGAVLLHDSALCFEAYSGGRDGLRKFVEWKDAFVATADRGTEVTIEERQNEADFAAMRLLHASRAEELASVSWIDPDGEALYLIDNLELRKHYGRVIGKIAASHHWSIENVVSRLPDQLNALASMPREWRVDPVKIACLLRCADAAHIDSRRAPDFLRALADTHGISAHHWKAQNWLERVDRDTADPDHHSLVFTSGKAFAEADAPAWWVAYDAICLVDRELRACADLLEKRPQAKESPPFRMRRVTGAASPEMASKTIATNGWSPRAVEIHVSSLERLVSQLGGTKLYGTSQLPIIVLRELIQNARDAVAARRALDAGYEGCIKVILSRDGNDNRISIEDDGIGMSYRVATGALLDFGSSFWASDLARLEFPGLISSGYKSVGEFGIGFYSVFMISRSVSVVSRRFDKGLCDATQLRFPNGVSLRPLISQGAPSNFPYSASTMVCLTLNSDVEDPSSILIRKERKGYDNEIRIPIDQCIAIICAGLDTRVELIKYSERAKVVHTPIRTLDTLEKRKNWLISILGGDSEDPNKEWKIEHAARLRPIVEDNNYLGLAALSTIAVSEYQSEVGSIKSVGGLSGSISLGNVSGYIGCIDYRAATAKRDAATEPVASSDAINAWANEQKTLLPPREKNPNAWVFATYSLADLQCDPSDIFTTYVLIREVAILANLDGLIDFACGPGLAIYRSKRMPHVDLYHERRGFGDIPTFWPVSNSSLLSLEQDERNSFKSNSIISCIERRAKDRGVSILQTCQLGVSKSFLGPVDVLVLRGVSHDNS